jgi:hypothetical protein
VRALLRDEPALVGTIVSAAISLALVLGIEPELGAAIGAFVTVVAGAWIRSSVYPQRSVDVLVNASAQQTATDLAAAGAAGAGTTGELTTTGEAVARQAAHEVLAGIEPPGPKGPVEEADPAPPAA